MGYALNNLDVKMQKYLTNTNGWLIEAGANNGIWQNNTLLLEQTLKVGGILLIEPSPKKYNECKNNRPNCIVENYALVSDNFSGNHVEGDFGFDDYASSLCGQVIDVHDYYDEGLKQALINKKAHHPLISVPVITLNKLLEQHNVHQIEFFSLDVEGYEIEVLNGMDLQKYRPNYFLIETSGIKERYDRIHEYMNVHNYKCIENISDNDSLFVPL